MRYDPAIVQSEVIIISLSMFHACGERSVNSVGLAASDSAHSYLKHLRAALDFWVAPVTKRLCLDGMKIFSW